MIKNLIFDFGGVIVDIDYDNAVKHFESLGLTHARELLDSYHQRDIFLELEAGQIDVGEFCRKLGAYCHRDISFQEARTAWLAFCTGHPQYRLDYLETLRPTYKLYILSNTNPFVMDWAESAEFTAARKPLNHYVDKVYASYRVKMVKPHREIFEYVLADTGADASETVFIDDGAANVETGKALGFHVLQPINGEDWRDKLNRLLLKHGG
jgi:putative hydrolase of the HAD superfamily